MLSMCTKFCGYTLKDFRIYLHLTYEDVCSRGVRNANVYWLCSHPGLGGVRDSDCVCVLSLGGVTDSDGVSVCSQAGWS